MYRRDGDWQGKSAEYIQEHLSVPFAWGSQDCACLAFGHVEAITGQNMIPDFVGKYETLQEGLDLIKTVTANPEATFEDGINFVLARSGVDELPRVLFAQRGDLVLYDGGEGPTLGVVSLNGITAYFPAANGLTQLPVAECRRAWRI